MVFVLDHKPVFLFVDILGTVKATLGHLELSPGDETRRAVLPPVPDTACMSLTCEHTCVCMSLTDSDSGPRRLAFWVIDIMELERRMPAMLPVLFQHEN